jgi:aryl-alcohol dehydrogenase-like predicted oxidoreductase
VLSRRDFLGTSLAAGAAFALTPQWLRAIQPTGGKLIQRAIPSSGEMLPVIGLTFGNISPSGRQADGTVNHAALKEALQTLVNSGGKFFDVMHVSTDTTEDVSAATVTDLGVQNKLFLALRGSPPGPPQPGPDAAKAHIETLFARFKVPKIDLVQVPAMGDPAHLAVLMDAKKEGRVRYIGVQGISDHQYARIESIMRTEPIDFIGVDYAVDNRGVEDTILPLAQERKIGVVAYFPFGAASLFRRASTTPLPDWAAEFDAKTWAHFFLKYVISHPAVTVARAGTSQAKHMLDNIGGGIGRLPDEATRKRMAALIDSWPPAAKG